MNGRVVSAKEKITRNENHHAFTDDGSAREDKVGISVTAVPSVFCSSFIRSSSTRRAWCPRRKKLNMVTANTQTPLNTIARYMFCGGLAAREARRASPAAKNEAEISKRVMTSI